MAKATHARYRGGTPLTRERERELFIEEGNRTPVRRERERERERAVY